eukprot:TRINITY_DN30558_c0_g1_i1.p1 TRINITY_DN30558_c0_g1~~TRINITY_DN30558_c0_g1_i1.p1  ORF type:complete len:167 (-),score=53.48 TRINITY_DN30558_c0_g1_i1:37-483(-)
MSVSGGLSSLVDMTVDSGVLIGSSDGLGNDDFDIHYPFLKFELGKHSSRMDEGELYALGDFGKHKHCWVGDFRPQKQRQQQHPHAHHTTSVVTTPIIPSVTTSTTPYLTTSIAPSVTTTTVTTTTVITTTMTISTIPTTSVTTYSTKP